MRKFVLDCNQCEGFGYSKEEVLFVLRNSAITSRIPIDNTKMESIIDRIFESGADAVVQLHSLPQCHACDGKGWVVSDEAESLIKEYSSLIKEEMF